MRIGIITPAYNAESRIGRCIGSVLAQNHADWHLVVVDDGSTDDTDAAIAAFDDPRVRRADPHAGVSAARNFGIAALPDTDAVLFLDADDWLAPDALARLIHALETFPAAIAATGPCGFVAEHAAADTRPRRIKRPPACDRLALLLERNLFANGGHLLIRRDAIERAGRFRIDLRFREDCRYRDAARSRRSDRSGARPAAAVRARARAGGLSDDGAGQPLFPGLHPGDLRQSGGDVALRTARGAAVAGTGAGGEFVGHRAGAGALRPLRLGPVGAAVFRAGKAVAEARRPGRSGACPRIARAPWAAELPSLAGPRWGTASIGVAPGKSLLGP